MEDAGGRCLLLTWVEGARARMGGGEHAGEAHAWVAHGRRITHAWRAGTPVEVQGGERRREGGDSAYKGKGRHAGHSLRPEGGRRIRLHWWKMEGACMGRGRAWEATGWRC